MDLLLELLARLLSFLLRGVRFTSVRSGAEPDDVMEGLRSRLLIGVESGPELDWPSERRLVERLRLELELAFE